ncbi:MAG: hypothetical protein H0W64_03295 [Gammaproteobacteria bacterium]|nr:hypothetical protein [Gammaproteobacteria bacterium]
MKSKLLFISAMFLTQTSYAFFCPSNFNQIDFGYTPEQVVAQCGKPDKEETEEVTPEGPQEWNYYIPQTVATGTAGQEQGTLKTQMTFDAAGKAVNISVNGIGVGSTTICGLPVRLGDTRDQIKNACGDPTLVNKQTTPANSPEKKKVTTFTYMSTPPGVLVFEDGRLTQKQ